MPGSCAGRPGRRSRPSGSGTTRPTHFRRIDHDKRSRPDVCSLRPILRRDRRWARRFPDAPTLWISGWVLDMSRASGSSADWQRAGRDPLPLPVFFHVLWITRITARARQVDRLLAQAIALAVLLRGRPRPFGEELVFRGQFSSATSSQVRFKRCQHPPASHFLMVTPLLLDVLHHGGHSWWLPLRPGWWSGWPGRRRSICFCAQFVKVFPDGHLC